MRYIRSLERKDVGLDTSMIPLGSCTMKLNAASEMIPVTWPKFSRMHPFVPVRAGRGLPARSSASSKTALCRITGFAAVSLQPNSGAQGEFAGLMTIRAYHRDRGEAPARRRPDPVVRARDESGERGDGRPEGGRGRVRRNGNVDVDGSARQGGTAPRRAGGADGDLSVDARRVRGGHPRDLRDRARARRPGVHGRREHERAGRADQPGRDRRRRLPPEPAQDVRDSARRRRPGHGTDCGGAASRAVSARPSRCSTSAATKAIPAGVGGAVGQREHPADLVRLHPHARRGRA